VPQHQRVDSEREFEAALSRVLADGCEGEEYSFESDDGEDSISVVLHATYRDERGVLCRRYVDQDLEAPIVERACQKEGGGFELFECDADGADRRARQAAYDRCWERHAAAR
jgi:hypothetical protein